MSAILELFGAIISNLGSLLLGSLDLVKILLRHPLARLIMLILIFITLIDIIIEIVRWWTK